MSQTDLKACPFCGNRPNDMVENIMSAFYIECDCGGMGPEAESEEGARIRWNKRSGFVTYVRSILKRFWK